MRFSHLIKVRCGTDESVKTELTEAVVREMRRVADCCTESDGEVSVEGVNCSFGSILRDDTTMIRIKPTRNGGGFTLESETVYKPSVWFWIFFAIDILLIETVVGFVVGMGATLGLYFYNRNLVQNTLKQALQNAAETVD